MNCVSYPNFAKSPSLWSDSLSQKVQFYSIEKLLNWTKLLWEDFTLAFRGSYEPLRTIATYFEKRHQNDINIPLINAKTHYYWRKKNHLSISWAKTWTLHNAIPLEFCKPTCGDIL